MPMEKNNNKTVRILPADGALAGSVMVIGC
jgi:hypothetical protein